MSSHVIKTGILSFGMSGKIFHAPFLHAHPEFELTAVLERSTKKAHLSYPSIKSYDTLDDLLADPDLELVVVNTPNVTHFEFAMQALKAGKHVLVEKPFTVSSSDAKLLFEEARKQQRFVMPYQNRRYDSDFQSVKNIIESGQLGNLVEVHFRFDRYKYVIGNKAAKETSVPGSGLAYDLGPHLLDQVISLFGKPLEWRKDLGHFRPETQVDDYAYFHLIYPGGMQVFITTSMLVADPLPAFVIHGSRGSFIKQRSDVQEKQLVAGMSPTDPQYGIEEVGKQGILTTVSSDGNRLQEQMLAGRSSYMMVFDDVLGRVREGKGYPVEEDEVLWQLAVLEG